MGRIYYEAPMQLITFPITIDAVVADGESLLNVIEQRSPESTHALQAIAALLPLFASIPQVQVAVQHLLNQINTEFGYPPGGPKTDV